jgi:hypothetical protein
LSNANSRDLAPSAEVPKEKLRHVVLNTCVFGHSQLTLMLLSGQEAELSGPLEQPG